MANNFKGIFIPANIVRNKNLSRAEEHLYCYILNFPDGCFASDKYIAETLGVGERTVSNALSSLRKRGLIYSNGNKRRLFASEITDDGFPNSGTKTSRTHEPDSPNSGNQTSRTRETRLPDLGEIPQGENRGANNNSIKNFSSNGSSNATQTAQTAQTSQASPASSASPTTTATAQNFSLIASERSERLNANGPQISYVVEKIKRFQFKYGLRHHTQICQTIYNQLDEEVLLRNNDNDPVSRNTSISNLLDYCLSDVFDPSALICDKPDFVLVNCLNDILLMRSRNTLYNSHVLPR